jgi:hypothetical protein
MDHRRDLAVGCERDLALDRDPYVRVRAGLRRGAKPKRESRSCASPNLLSAAHCEASLLAKCGDEMARGLKQG